MTIQRKVAIVYYSPRANRRFLTLRAAVRAEARAIILARYPTERFDGDGGGFFWHELPRAEVLYRRMCRVVRMAMRG